MHPGVSYWLRHALFWFYLQCCTYALYVVHALWILLCDDLRLRRPWSVLLHMLPPPPSPTTAVATSIAVASLASASFTSIAVASLASASFTSIAAATRG